MHVAIRRVTGLLLLLASATCLAHHGVTPHYDNDRRVTVEGVVSKFEFINPHSFVYVSIVNAAGVEEVWQCELASRSVLTRNGLTADAFKVGEPITIEGAAGRRNPTGCAVRTAYFADGSVLQSTEFFGPESTLAAEIPADPNSIVGTWTMKRFSVSMYEGVLTPAGEAARTAFDPITDDPAIYCETGSPVRFWVNVNEPFEIRIEADEVVVDHRFMDSERIIYLTDKLPLEDAPRSAMGYSIGHFAGRTLEITTAHFTAAPLEPRRALMHTKDLKLSETLAVNSATGELEITWLIDDPAYFSEPLTQRELFVRSARDPEPYNCKPGYQQ